MLLWHPLIKDLKGGSSVEATVKDYYLGDQFGYLAIAANVANGYPSNVEPYTISGASIYPTGYYWLIGQVSRVFQVGVLGSWNVLGMASTVVLLVVCGALGWSLTKSRWIWPLSAVPFLVGTYQYYFNGDWMAIYGRHAVLWPAYATLFNPGAEVPALALTVTAVLALVSGQRRSGPSRALRDVIAGLSLGLVFYTHAYVAIFALTAVVLFLVLQAIELGLRKREVLVGLLTSAVLGVSVMFLSPKLAIFRLLAPAAAGALFVLVVSLSRGSLRHRLLRVGVAATLVGLPVLVRVGQQLLSPGSFFFERQITAAQRNLAVQFGAAVTQSLPVLLLALACGITLWSRRFENSTDRTWLAFLASIFATTLFLGFNHLWGVNLEPYRFLPYGQFLLLVLSVPLLVLRIGRSRKVFGFAARSLCVALLILTIPTTVAFAKATDKTLRMPENEQATYRKVAALSATEGLVLFDPCLNRGVFKAMTGMRVVAYNRGIAVPEKRGELDVVLGALRRNALSGRESLRAAGITRYVTHSRCSDPPPAAAYGHFGDPISRVRFIRPESCGLPADLELLVFAVTEQTKSSPTNWAPSGPDEIAAEPKCALR